MCASGFSEEITRQYFSPVYKTKINDDKVNVRILPGIRYKKVSQLNRGDIVLVTGISSKREVIDNYDGYWLRIDSEDEKDSWGMPKGWVFSKYVDFDKNINVTTLKFKKFIPAAEQYCSQIVLEIQRGGKNKEVKICPDKLVNQDYYTFTWSDDNPDFYFTDCPGTYVWKPNTKEIAHITYFGDSAESAWVHFNDDFTYMFQDGGTSPGPRGLGIYKVNTNEMVFSGSYYENIKLNGDTVQIVVACDDWEIENGYVDSESLNYAKKFKETDNKPPMSNDGLANTLLAIYELNYKTNKRKFIKCEWIETQ